MKILAILYPGGDSKKQPRLVRLCGERVGLERFSRKTGP